MFEVEPLLNYNDICSSSSWHEKQKPQSAQATAADTTAKARKLAPVIYKDGFAYYVILLMILLDILGSISLNTNLKFFLHF